MICVVCEVRKYLLCPLPTISGDGLQPVFLERAGMLQVKRGGSRFLEFIKLLRFVNIVEAYYYLLL